MFSSRHQTSQEKSKPKELRVQISDDEIDTSLNPEYKKLIDDDKKKPAKLSLEDLLQEQKELQESISLLEKFIQKNKRPFYFLMSAIMLVTAIYSLEKLLYADPQAREEFPRLREQLQAQLESQLTTLTNNFPLLTDIAKEAFIAVSNAFYVSNMVTCTGLMDPPPPYNATCRARSIGGYWENAETKHCTDDMDEDWWAPDGDDGDDWDNEVDFSCALAFQSASDDGCSDHQSEFCDTVVGPDPCSSFIDKWCASFTGRNANIADRQRTNDSLQHLDELTDNAIEFDLYGNLGNALTFYAICLTFGELAPLIMIAFMALTRVFDNCVSSWQRCNLSEEDRNTISATARKYHESPEPYPALLQDLKTREKAVVKAIASASPSKQEAKAPDEKEAPRRNLFYFFPDCLKRKRVDTSHTQQEARLTTRRLGLGTE